MKQSKAITTRLNKLAGVTEPEGRNEMKSKNYWIKHVERADDTLETTLFVTDQWQVRPQGAEEISEHEYNIWKERLNKDEPITSPFID